MKFPLNFPEMLQGDIFFSSQYKDHILGEILMHKSSSIIDQAKLANQLHSKILGTG